MTCAGSSTSAAFAVTAPLLDASECDDLAALFDDGRFRSTVDMARHRFGDGRYRYFDHPLPAPITDLRTSFYERLAPIANDWATLIGGPGPSPLDHANSLDLLPGGRAGAADAADPALRRRRLERPAPRPLRDVFFPFQVLTVLSEPAPTSRAASSC